MEDVAQTRQWPPKTHKRLAKELAKKSMILKKYKTGDQNKNIYNFISGKYDIEETTLDEITSHYETLLGTEEIYQTNHLLDLVYYNFTIQQPNNILEAGKDELEAGKGEADSADPHSKFTTRLYFLLVMRQHIRILKRLINFTYIRQNKDEEVIQLNNETHTISHKFYDKLEIMSSERIAMNMNILGYIYHSLKKPLNVEKVTKDSIELGSENDILASEKTFLADLITEKTFLTDLPTSSHMSTPVKRKLQKFR